MRTGDHQFDAKKSRSGLERFCLCLIEFLSAQATDPHLYFQNKLAGDVSNAKSTEDLWNLLEGLIAWIGASHPHPSAIKKLDNILKEKSLPSYTLMTSTTNRKLGRILAEGQITCEAEYREVRNHLGEVSVISHADRLLCECLVNEYES